MPKTTDISGLDTLKEQVLEANLELVRRGLVLFTFGNASGIDRQRGLVVIKPSGVDYTALAATDMVVTDMDGRVVDGKLRPSSDLATHLLLYKEFPGIGGVVHTHSEYATAWAQAGLEIPAYGTTHADYFYGPVPVTAELTAEEIGGDYVHNTGIAITRRFRVSIRMPFRLCWWPATRLSAGGRHRSMPPTTRLFWKRSPGWVLYSYSATKLWGGFPGAAGSALFSQARRQRNLWTGEMMRQLGHANLW